jgi:hypothetical protein
VPFPANGQTVLVIDGVEIPYGAGRGVRQTLTPIGQATQLRRTVNGDLIDISSTLFRKYTTTITCTDQAAPTLDNIWPGMEIVIDCAVELPGTATRPVVSGSTRVDGDATFYRPQLTMMVTSFSVEVDEWQAVVGWSLSAEEV